VIVLDTHVLVWAANDERALAHGATLMTADERLLDWDHALPRHDART